MAKGFKPFHSRFPGSPPGTVIYAGDAEPRSEQGAFINYRKTAECINTLD